MRRRLRTDSHTNHLETPTVDRRAALKTLATLPFAIGGIEIAQPDGWTPLWNGRDLAGWDTYLGRPHKSSDVPRLQHLVQALKVDAGVGALGEHEFEIELDVAEASFGAQVGRLAGGAVENHTARRGASGELRRPEDALVADEAGRPE